MRVLERGIQPAFSGNELAEAHRWTVDETHDLTIGCQARGGCKGCVGVPRGSLAERISD